jgi:hypothetical protein
MTRYSRSKKQNILHCTDAYLCVWDPYACYSLCLMLARKLRTSWNTLKYYEINKFSQALGGELLGYASIITL